LEPLQRLQLRDQLQDLWRSYVEQITVLAVRFHSAESDQDTAADPAAIAASLSRSRLGLAEVEAAMRRLDTGQYGVCEACHDSIPFDELAAWPYRRSCARCDPRPLTKTTGTALMA
jgi:RNA polymerase-binding transcription factor DksA